MRILMLTTSYPKYPGETTAPFIEEIAAGLARRGHDVHVVAPWHPDIQREPVERGVHLHFFRYAPRRGLNIWGYAQSLHADTLIKRQALGVTPFALAHSARALLRVMQREMRAGTPPFQVVHAHWVLPNAVPAALVARSVRLPLVVSLHGSDVYMAEQFRATTPFAGLAFRAANAVTACSRDLFVRGVRLGAPPASSVVIPYGINLDEFRPDPDARGLVRAELALPDDAPLVVALGRLVHKKGFGVLLDAWPHVLEQHPNALLALVGYGDLRASLEQQAARLGITRQVRFTGQVERKRAASYLAAADVFTLPIVSDQGTDGLPNTLLEAMGAGRPVVASRVAGVPDVIEDGQHGLLVPDRDPPALAAAIIRLLDAPEEAARLGAAARQRIETELTWDDAAARFEQVYRRVWQR
jgi:glycosyltransferase involved in cell wall biosynthesis